MAKFVMKREPIEQDIRTTTEAACPDEEAWKLLLHICGRTTL